MTAITEDLDREDRAPAEPGSSPAGVRRSASVRGRLAFGLVLLVLVTAIVGTRLSLHHRSTPVVSVAHPAAPVPASPAIESSWGIRYTGVILLADGGGVELRYQVLDLNKAEKIHLGDAGSNQLPTITVDGTSGRVTPSAVLMHFHHGDTADGRTYSIVYGNAGGVVHTGDYVSITMKDGATLKHVQVSS
ncbi:hypothetical protein M6D93_11930 [Jatrophihabitans telluris]|uniref:Uncharacterized protein n=1 Tax=Jatrophihabitans telluris TaxID=2038343 RepID=A0ABY4QVK1_9ACTN|nr:hypothetical protein [Jatrophihabitans telluris]UQX87015.1 hypothetical protein M6D93_11930 [Jatrophihabitans telluris]